MSISGRRAKKVASTRTTKQILSRSEDMNSSSNALKRSYFLLLSRRPEFRRLAALAVLFFVVTVAIADLTVGGVTQLSVNTSGTAPGGKSSFPAAGGNARNLAFASDATDIIENDINRVSDIFYRQRNSQSISLASVNTAGVAANGASGSPAVSTSLPSGFFVIVFESSATNLSPVQTSAMQSNIFIHVPTLGATEMISAAPNFTTPDGSAYLPSVTAILNKNNKNEVLVVFGSDSTNLVSTDSNGQADIFLATAVPPSTAEIANGTVSTVTTILISKAALAGEQANGPSFSPKISANGRYIAFVSRATNLTNPALTNTNSQIYRHDILTGNTILISQDSSGNVGDNESFFPEISYNGRYIAYSTFSTNLGEASPATNGLSVLRHDTVTGITTRVNINEQSVVGNAEGFLGISPNGRLIAFADSSSSLVPNDTNDVTDIFVKDLETGAIKLMSRDPISGLQSNATSTNPALTSDSLTSLTSVVAFESIASNLTTPSISDGNGNIFTAEVKLSVPVLSSGTRLDVPPDVTVRSKSLTFNAQVFTFSASAINAAIKASAATRLVRYDWDIRGSRTVGNKRRNIRIVTRTKRNTLTLSKLRKSNHDVRYRVVLIDAKGKVRLRTPYSPIQKVRTN